jgi:hypothetical protein
MEASFHEVTPLDPLAAQTPSVLEPKVERREGPPLWISANAVADEEKVIKLDLIDSDSLRRRVEKQSRDLGGRLPKSGAGEKPEIARIPPSECKSETFSEDGRGGGPSATFKELVMRSKSIVRGSIRTIDLGFSFGIPSSLLGVEVSEVIKGAVPKSPLYLDYPVARFRIGPLYFCNATKGYEPSPGDEILLFDVAGPVDRTGVLYAPRMDQVFLQSQSGILVVPTPLKNTAGLESATSLEDVVTRLRSGELSSREGSR